MQTAHTCMAWIGGTAHLIHTLHLLQITTSSTVLRADITRLNTCTVRTLLIGCRREWVDFFNPFPPYDPICLFATKYGVSI